MQVTDVRIRKINQEGKMKAIVSVTLNDAFVVHDVKVVEGQSGLFVAMPSKRMPDGEFKDIAHPISQEARRIIQEAVLRAFEEAEQAQLEAEAAAAEEKVEEAIVGEINFEEAVEAAEDVVEEAILSAEEEE